MTSSPRVMSRATRSRARRRPNPPPMAAMRSDSSRTRPITSVSPNPSDFSTASSPVRSRTAIAMVLPVTRSRVKKTTEPIAMMRNSMLPICLTKAAAKADSVWVRVSPEEFANSASIAFATRSATSGFSTRTTYQPTLPWK